MYEEKKGHNWGRNVFSSDEDSIPQFSVIKVMFRPFNSGQFDQGFTVSESVACIRPCEFMLYSMQSPLGLGLLPSTYEAGLQQS
jgi:hypothetical protein